MDAVWSLLEVTPFAATMTVTRWRKKNSSIAWDLAVNGVPPERVLEAARSVQRRLGSPPRTLAIVQDELGRMAPPAPPASSTPAVTTSSSNFVQRGSEDELTADQRAANIAKLGQLFGRSRLARTEVAS